MTSLDYTDAYYSLAVRGVDRKYLRFQSKGMLYEYTSQPNGLSSACRFFTKVVKVPLSILREHHEIICTGYLDDSNFVNRDAYGLHHDTAVAADLFQ